MENNYFPPQYTSAQYTPVYGYHDMPAQWNYQAQAYEQQAQPMVYQPLDYQHPQPMQYQQLQPPQQLQQLESRPVLQELTNVHTPPPASPGYYEQQEECKVEPLTPPLVADYPTYTDVASEVKEEMEAPKALTTKRKQASGSDEMPPINTATKKAKLDDADRPEGHFCMVDGRLCVVGSLKKYDVFVDEIRRRADKPEALVRSHIGPLLKRGKVRGTGDDLLQVLESRQIDVTVPLVNRKQYKMSTMTALIEGEAVQLSADHRDILNEHFPFTSLARLYVRSIGSPIEMVAAATEAAAARRAFATFMIVLNAWTAGGWTQGKETILASPLSEFARASHAFGIEECLLMSAVYQKFLAILEQELITYCDCITSAGFGHAANLHEFPPGIEAPAIPEGHLPEPSADEEGQAATIFAELSGRLTLQNKKYEVKVAEVQRRIRAPESINLSILGSLLKKGKTKNNCELLKHELKEHSITLSTGKRKMAKNTAFTPLVEGEALDIAKDLETELKRSFKDGDLTQAIVNRIGPQLSYDQCRFDFSAARNLSSSFRAIVLSLQLPVGPRIPTVINPDAHLMLNYSSLTHGYGPDAVASWMGFFSQMFDKIEQMFPQI